MDVRVQAPRRWRVRRTHLDLGSICMTERCDLFRRNLQTEAGEQARNEAREIQAMRNRAVCGFSLLLQDRDLIEYGFKVLAVRSHNFTVTRVPG